MKIDEAECILRVYEKNRNQVTEDEMSEAVSTVLDYLQYEQARTVHELKLSTNFCDAVYNGVKTFELRKNDRGFQTGDLIRFTPVKFDETDPASRFPEHPIQGKLYEITYVLSGWGLSPETVALGIKEYSCGISRKVIK